jgi:hypothetical protein
MINPSFARGAWQQHLPFNAQGSADAKAALSSSIQYSFAATLKR